MRVAILGNGISGVSAAIRLRQLRPDWTVTLVSGESTHHYSRPALMYLYMGHMTYRDTKPFEDDFWARERIDLVRGWVTGIDVGRRQLRLHDGRTLGWDRLLLATGSKSNRFGWPGQDLRGVQGLYDLRDLRLLYENGRGAEHAVIVGGGLIGIELGEMLHSRGVHVTFLIREDSYWDNVLPPEESEIVSRHIESHGMRLIRGQQLERIEDDGTGRACGVVAESGERIACQIVGLTAGVSPNLDLVRDSPIETGRGILVDRALRTSVEHVWAAGDCAEIVIGNGKNLIQQVWYTGKRQGRAAGESIAGETVEYQPGIWYNSAKFLDIEYQVYGDVPHRPRDGERHLYWEHPDGRRSVRLVVRDGVVVGFNLMGLRYRHEVCERWIRERRPLDHVLANLGEAGFDPEFEPRLDTQARSALGRPAGSAP